MQERMQKISVAVNLFADRIQKSRDCHLTQFPSINQSINQSYTTNNTACHWKPGGSTFIKLSSPQFTYSWRNSPIYQLQTHSYSRTPHLHWSPPKRQYLSLLHITNHTDTTATLSRPFVQTLGGTPATVMHSREILVISTWIKP